MAKDFESLKQQALVIKNEVEDGANNTERVGGMLEDIVESMKLGTTEFNVSAFFPTGGTSGSNKYDLASAIGKVPAELRTDGLTVSFLNESGNTEKWEFGGGSWGTGSFSQVGAGKITELSNKTAGVNYLTCETAASTAAKTVSITGLTSLTTGIRLLVKMTNNNTASNATLNINSLGAKPLYYDNERASSDNSWEAGEVIDVYYDGTNFYAGNVQGGSSDGGNKTLTWNTDAATTRKQVQLKYRKELLQISYKDGEGNAVNEQFIGTDLSDTKFPLSSYWMSLQESYEFYDGWQSGYLNSSGAFGSSGNYKYLPYISLPDTVKNVYLFNTFKVEAGTKGICFYDENQTFIAGYDTETGVRTYPKPEGAKFFRVCKGKNMDGRVALSKNEILDSLLQTEDETSGESYTNIIGDIPTSLFKKGLVKKDGSINTVAWQ